MVLHACFFAISSLKIHSGDMLSGRNFKLIQGWLRAQLGHLDNRYPSFLHECVHFLSVGCVVWCVCVPCSRCTMTSFSLSTTLHHLHEACNPCEANFPSRHPIISVVFVCLPRLLPQVSCQSTHLLPTMLAHNLPARVMQERNARQPDFFPQAHTIPWYNKHLRLWFDENVCEAV